MLKYFQFLLLFTFSFSFGQDYACFDKNYSEGLKAFNKKNFKAACVFFNKALNECSSPRTNSNVKDLLIKSQKELLSQEKSEFSKTIKVNNQLKREAESVKYSMLSYLYEKVDPTKSLRLAEKSILLDENKHNVSLLNQLYHRNQGGFYSKQFDHRKVLSLKFLPGDSMFLAGDEQNKTFLWNINTGKYETIFKQNTKEILFDDDRSAEYGDGGRTIYSIALNQSRNKFLTASDNEVVYWDLIERKYIQKFDFYWQDVQKVAFINDSIFICKVQDKDSFFISSYNVKQDSSIFTLNRKESDYYDLVTLPQQNAFVISRSDSTCEFWKIGQNKPFRTFKTPQHIFALAVNEKINRLVLGGYDGTIYLYDLNTLNLLNILKSHKATIKELSINDRKLISLCYNDEIYSWDILNNEEEIQPLNNHKVYSNNTSTIEISPTKDLFLSFSNIRGGSHSGAAFDEENFIRLWCLNKTSKVNIEKIKTNDSCAVLLDFDKKIAVINSHVKIKNFFYIADLNSGKVIETITENSSIHNLSVSQNLKYISYQLRNGTIRVLDLAARSVKFDTNVFIWANSIGVNDVKNQLVLIPNGKYDKYQIWSIETGKLIDTIEHNEIPYGLNFSKNGKYMVGYGWNYVPMNNLSVYETLKYKSLLTIGESGESIKYANLTPSGECILELSMRNSIFNKNPTISIKDSKTGFFLTNLSVNLFSDACFYVGKEENKIYVFDYWGSELSTWIFSTPVNKILKDGSVFTFNESFYNINELYEFFE